MWHFKLNSTEVYLELFIKAAIKNVYVYVTAWNGGQIASILTSAPFPVSVPASGFKPILYNVYQRTYIEFLYYYVRTLPAETLRLLPLPLPLPLLLLPPHVLSYFPPIYVYIYMCVYSIHILTYLYYATIHFQIYFFIINVGRVKHLL